MSFADNWARVFVVITFLTFGEAQIIGGIVPNLIAFTLFLGGIGYFASTGKWLRCLAGKIKISDLEITAGVGKRLPEFKEWVQLMLGGGPLVEN